MKRLQALDNLRGMAILLVLAHHYLPGKFNPPLSWSGVDLFFVLSGFLIADILLRNTHAKNYFSTFYIRRGARIIPLYWLLLLLFAVLKIIGTGTFSQSLSATLPLWSYFIFAQNFLYAARGFFGDPWLDVTWSLALEEQFYIFLSVSIKFLNKRWMIALSVFLILLAPILRVLAGAGVPSYVLPLHRADSLLLGVLIAIVWQSDSGISFFNRHARHLKWSFFLFLPAVYYLIVSQAYYGSASGHFILAFFYANLLLLALVTETNKPNLLFTNKILEWFGLRSYGIYLLHKPIQLILTGIFQRFSLAATPLVTLIATAMLLFAVSELSFRLIEKPLIEMGHKFKYEYELPA